MLPGVLRFLAVVLVALAFAHQARAEKSLALVVGIDTYDNLSANHQLDRAINDSRSVGAVLEALGFDVERGENLTRAQFNVLWQKFLDKVAPGDTVALFFSGHGIEIEGLNFLLPRDTPKVAYGRQEQIKRESLSVLEFMLDLRKRRPQVSLIILDACRDNPMIPEGEKSVANSGGLASMTDPPEGTFIMYSAGAGETALDRLPDDPDTINSVYTRKLLPLLQTPGLTLPDMARQVRSEVRDLAASVPHRQRPAYYDGLIGTFSLRPGTPAIPAAEKADADRVRLALRTRDEEIKPAEDPKRLATRVEPPRRELSGAADIALLPPQKIHFRSRLEAPLKPDTSGADEGWVDSVMTITVMPVAFVHRTEPGRKVRILQETLDLSYNGTMHNYRSLYVVEITDAPCGDRWYCIKGNTGPETLEPGRSISRETMFIPASSVGAVTWGKFVNDVLTKADLPLTVTYRASIEGPDGSTIKETQMATTCRVDTVQLRAELEVAKFRPDDRVKPVFLQADCLPVPTPVTAAATK